MKYLKVLFITSIIALIALITVLMMEVVGTNAATKEELKEGPKLIITNSTNETYIVMLYWIDHPFLDQTLGKPMNTIGAELVPGESFYAINRIPVGEFYVDIRKIQTTGITRKYFFVEPEIHKLIICFKIERGKEVIDILKGWLMTD